MNGVKGSEAEEHMRDLQQETRKIGSMYVASLSLSFSFSLSLSLFLFLFLSPHDVLFLSV